MNFKVVLWPFGSAWRDAVRYVCKRMNAAEEEQFEIHLMQCPACQDEVDRAFAAFTDIKPVGPTLGLARRSDCAKHCTREIRIMRVRKQ